MSAHAQEGSRPFRMIGAERSYFTAKARPALRAKRLYFEEVLADRAGYQDILRRTGLAFIPVVITPEDDTWQDTSDILDALEARLPEPALYPRTPVQRIAAYLMELYADEFLVLPAMHYRWGTPAGQKDASDAFAAVTGNARNSAKFAARMAGSLPFLGVNAATGPAIEAHFAELLDAMEEVLSAQSFLLGEQMSLADCAFMGPFYAHLYLDLVPGQIVRSRATRVSHWIERCNHPDPGAFHGFLPGDALHPGVQRILALIGADAAPLLLDSVAAFGEWAAQQSAAEMKPPRGVGSHVTRLRGVEVTRFTSSYAPWMVQRPGDAYAALGEDARAAVDAALAGTGCERLLAYRPRRRAGKRGFTLVLETAPPSA